MKKFILVLAFILILPGCAGANSEDEGIVMIGERFFVNQMMEIFLNHQQYLGSVIQYEGMFRSVATQNGDEFFIVYRLMSSCCGDEVMGLEVDMDGFTPFPDNAWVEVRGTLDLDEGFLVLRTISITEMAERGAELVS